ncbi:MAG: type I glyceraldehyde-3-phosphate dehydrogenase [Bacteroidota bacterium]|nr:type I glyceraldehyde-3-phosphate dehydrogenase [Bacteroidota bacterium]
MKIRIAINGFGRIGRNFFRLCLNHPLLEVVAINDIADAGTMAHLLKYDSIHGILPNQIEVEDHLMRIDGKAYPFLNHRNISDIDWRPYNVDFVIECTGKHKTRELLDIHLKNGAKKVILSVPPEDTTIKTIVLGVNHDVISEEDTIISNASCTTNNAAPMLKVLDDLCTINQAYITTVHSYTTDQSLHDVPHRDLRRARGAAQSIVPTTTGAAKALTRIFPHLEGKIGGCGIRVPVANGSLTDITCTVHRKVSIEQINQAFLKASASDLKNILGYTSDPIVSVDIIGNRLSCLFDSQLTSVIDNTVKIVGWYDNEIGYSSRLIDLVLYISKK